MKNLSPIILFVYNRPWHTRQVVEALQKNELASESELFIFSDGYKDEKAVDMVKEVREYLKTIDGFKKVTIIEREKNWGLANNIIDGVTKIVNEYGKVIVLEDDLITSHCFLKFMNEGLEMYEDEGKVASIHGYIYPIDNLSDTFFIRGADCWGWSTWKRAWRVFEPDGKKLLKELRDKKLENEADFNGAYGYTKMLHDQINGKNDSWAVRWYLSAFLADMLTLYPGKALVRNIGIDNSGTHCGASAVFNINLANNYNLVKIDVAEDLEARAKIEGFFKSIKLTLLDRIRTRLKGLFS